MLNVPGASSSESAIELIALRVLPTAIRCRDVARGDTITYRRVLPDGVPGERLVVAPRARWKWRRTSMVGGTLLHRGFSVRALWQSGFARPEATAQGLTCPAEADARLADALEHLDRGDWLSARCLLLDVLADVPGSLVAHSRLAELLSGLCHHDAAMGHATAAIRLGSAALSAGSALPLDATRPSERALLTALVLRARVLLERGQRDAAAADLRRALAWDPADAAGAGPHLAALRDSAPDPRPAELAVRSGASP